MEITLKLSEKEAAAIEMMAKELELTPEQILRQGLRSYQMQQAILRGELPELSKAPPDELRAEYNLS